MRVVGGVAGGRRLRAPPGRRVRPTSERVREAVFSSLEALGVVEGADVVDLFAGTGALGIEALSRGASSAVFVDSDPAAMASVEANLALTGLEGGTTVRMDALRFVAESPRVFSLAFVDPPYAFRDWPSLLIHLKADLAVLEWARQIDPGEGWGVLRCRQYGGTVVTIVRRQ